MGTPVTGVQRVSIVTLASDRRCGCSGGPRHQRSRLPSRKKPPVGPLSGRVTPQRTGPHLSQRATLARHVDDPSPSGPPQQWQEGEGGAPGAEEIRLHGFVDDGEVRSLRAGPDVVEDGGVVHQGITAPESFGHPPRRCTHAAVVGHVELARGDIHRVPHACGRSSTLAQVARAQHHRVPLTSKLAADLQSDPAIGAGHNRHRSRATAHRALLRCGILWS